VEARCAVLNASIVTSRYCAGGAYGADFVYCFDCAQGWYFTEEVTPLHMGCSHGTTKIGQPYYSPDGCVPDHVFDPGDPPTFACYDVNNQTLLCGGPTEDTETICSYENTQVIDVSISPNVVSTTSFGTTGTCTF
jgi:hypothetical protein